MAIYKHGNRYRLDFTLKGIRYIKGFDTEAEAVAWEERARARVKLGLPAEDDVVTPKDMTLADALKVACQRWMRQRDGTGSMSNGNDVVERLGPNKKVSQLSRADLDKMVEDLINEDLAPSTINRKLSAVSSILKCAIEAGVINTVRIRKLPEGEGRVRYLSFMEEMAVIKYFKDKRDTDMGDFFQVAVDTGARLSELLAMLPSWIREESQGSYSLTFPGGLTKSGKTRTVPLTKRAATILQRRMAKGEPTIWPVKWNKDKVGSKWAAMRTALGMATDTEFVFHACRHTCGTRLLEATGNIVLVRDWLGHADIKTTMIYAKLVAGQLVAGAKALDKMFKAA
jgi:integrase